MPLLSGDPINKEVPELAFMIKCPDRLKVIRHPGHRRSEARELPPVGQWELMKVLLVAVAVSARNLSLRRLNRLAKEVGVVEGHELTCSRSSYEGAVGGTVAAERASFRFSTAAPSAAGR
jgi:hypothetical protein